MCQSELHDHKRHGDEKFISEIELEIQACKRSRSQGKMNIWVHNLVLYMTKIILTEKHN